MSGYYIPGGNVPFQHYSVNANAVPDPNTRNGAPLPRIPDTSYTPGLQENPFQPGVSGPFVQYTEQNIQSRYNEIYEDISGPLGSTQGSNSRVRRRALPGEQVKHRRTRSGCFTCRQRRVKVNTRSLSDLTRG